MVITRLVVALMLFLAPGLAQAYIGPGAGVGAITAALGVLGAIFLALLAVIYYPIKRLLKRRRKGGGRGGSKVTESRK